MVVSKQMFLCFGFLPVPLYVYFLVFCTCHTHNFLHFNLPPHVSCEYIIFNYLLCMAIKIMKRWVCMNIHCPVWISRNQSIILFSADNFKELRIWSIYSWPWPNWRYPHFPRTHLWSSILLQRYIYVEVCQCL